MRALRHGTSTWPLHPLLVAALPIASMYAAYPGRSDLDEIARALLVTVAAVAAAWTVIALPLRDARKAAMLVSASLVLVLLVPEQAFAIVRRRYAVAAAALLMAALAVWLRRMPAPLARATVLLNVMAAGFLIPPVASLARFHLFTTPLAARRAPPVEVPRAAAPVAPGATARPDIYYVIFDRYGDADTMRRYGIDNEPLYRFLAGKGFYVARDSRANYIKTALSLASSLNMTYHDDIARQVGPQSGNWLPINFRLREHVVGHFLTAQGYRYIHVGSWWWPTRGNPQAHQQVNHYAAVPQPVMRLLQRPLLAPIAGALDTPLVDDRLQQWHRVTRQVAAMGDIARQPGPKFVFVHFLLPHAPYVFERDGRYVSLDEENRRSGHENYRNQVLFANEAIRTLVNLVVSRSPQPPVVIVQGDEGPYPPGIGGADRADEYRWRDLTPDQLLERSGILNAYLLPGGGAGLWPSISPVNSFRVVFNRYFGTGLPLLPDRTYRHDSENRPYSWDDVTATVRRRSGSRHESR